MARTKADAAWKDILNAYFKNFIDYCLPQLGALIDWDKSYEALDSELQEIIPGGLGKRLLDKLFKVYLQDGQEQWVLFHIEIQGKKRQHFRKAHVCIRLSTL